MIALAAVAAVDFRNQVAQPHKRSGVPEIALQVIEPLHKLFPAIRLDRRFVKLARSLGDGFAELRAGHGVERKSDHGEVFRQILAAREVVESGDQFPLGQVSGGAEDDHQARPRGTSLRLRNLRRGRHGDPFYPPAGRSTCPPNLKRMADRVFSAKLWSWRERKRV